MPEHYEVTERGFVHWSPVPTTYGHEVRVYESSAAEQACMWLTVGPGTTDDRDGERCAHLTYEQALQVHARVGAWLDLHRSEFARAKADEYAAALAAELGVQWAPTDERRKGPHA
jgi:hypothetical protein